MYDFYNTHGVPGLFQEIKKAPECMSSLWIILYDFYKTSRVTGGPKHFSEVVEALECLSSL